MVSTGEWAVPEFYYVNQKPLSKAENFVPSQKSFKPCPSKPHPGTNAARLFSRLSFLTAFVTLQKRYNG
jgi:hypothetical protein